LGHLVVNDWFFVVFNWRLVRFDLVRHG